MDEPLKKVDATTARNRFSETLEGAILEPVVVEKKGRPVAVIMSIREFRRMKENEDKLLANEARVMESEGMLGDKENEYVMNMLKL